MRDNIKCFELSKRAFFYWKKLRNDIRYVKWLDLPLSIIGNRYFLISLVVIIVPFKIVFYDREDTMPETMIFFLNIVSSILFSVFMVFAVVSLLYLTFRRVNLGVRTTRRAIKKLPRSFEIIRTSTVEGINKKGIGKVCVLCFQARRIFRGEYKDAKITLGSLNEKALLNVFFSMYLVLLCTSVVPGIIYFDVKNSISDWPFGAFAFFFMTVLAALLLRITISLSKEEYGWKFFLGVAIFTLLGFGFILSEHEGNLWRAILAVFQFVFFLPSMMHNAMVEVSFVSQNIIPYWLTAILFNLIFLVAFIFFFLGAAFLQVLFRIIRTAIYLDQNPKREKSMDSDLSYKHSQSTVYE